MKKNKKIRIYESHHLPSFQEGDQFHNFITINNEKIWFEGRATIEYIRIIPGVIGPNLYKIYISFNNL